MSTWLWWSSGKDSAWALHTLQETGLPVTALVTTVNRSFDRVAMHGVREELLRAQASAAGLPLETVQIPHPCSNEIYERAVGGLLARARAAAVTHMAFGDLFLEEVRTYRIRLLEGTGIEPVFPIWGRDTAELAAEMQGGGLEAQVTCIDPKVLARSFAGRSWDAGFLRDLPVGVDPCGENGEFHSFATAGPMFASPIAVRSGEVVERDGFVFADLLPQER
ncbi:MAG: ATP-binding protein [Deltaproteobacteria bacterium]|jgi:uncharacterized protein (TIGR00290 family)|nr:ATP-binding protein [Deltaproteobacteria bacterium]